MSHAYGICLLPDGTKYYFEYDGTSDICCTRLYVDTEELDRHWRKDNLKECICKITESIPCILSTAYGAGFALTGYEFLWFSEICSKCICITGKVHDWEEIP